MVNGFSAASFKTYRGKDAKRHSLLRLIEFGLFRNIVDKLSLNLRNILISPLEGEKKFLSEWCELRNFREGDNLKYICRNSNSDLPKQLRCIPLNKFQMLWRKFNLFFETVFSRFTSYFSLNRKAAFTLAEVLITLGIIGIVASMTLPTLVKNYQNKANIARLEKIYSILSQASLHAQEEHGDFNTWNILDENQNSTREIFSYFEPYLKIVRKCDNKSGCWAKTTYSLTGGARWSGDYYNGDKYINVTLADGTNLSFDICEPFYSVFGLPNDIMRPFIIFGVDVNGNKRPNVIGYDIFFFALSQKGIIPFGIGNNSQNCSKNIISNTSGYGCAYKVLQEKKINY